MPPPRLIMSTEACRTVKAAGQIPTRQAARLRTTPRTCRPRRPHAWKTPETSGGPGIGGGPPTSPDQHQELPLLLLTLGSRYSRASAPVGPRRKPAGLNPIVDILRRLAAVGAQRSVKICRDGVGCGSRASIRRYVLCWRTTDTLALLGAPPPELCGNLGQPMTVVLNGPGRGCDRSGLALRRIAD
jgi:hypothetical protein